MEGVKRGKWGRCVGRKLGGRKCKGICGEEGIVYQEEGLGVKNKGRRKKSSGGKSEIHLFGVEGSNGARIDSSTKSTIVNCTLRGVD